MKVIPLFPEPFNLDDVYRCLGDDDFFSCAFLVMGFEASWRAGLDQVARLIAISERDGREWRPLYRMVSLLIQRAETFDQTARFLDEIVVALELLPTRDLSFLQEIKMAHLHKVDPQAWTRAKNRAWMLGYQNNLDALAAAGRS